MKLEVTLPPYPEPKTGRDASAKVGLGWRSQVQRAMLAAARKRGIWYLEGEELEVDLILYTSDRQIAFHDVDNMLKHVFDALQGKLGRAGKAQQQHKAILPNNHQIRRVAVEKRLTTTRKQHSRLIVRDLAA